MSIHHDGHRYTEDDFITFATGRRGAPFVFLTRDGAHVFVSRTDAAGTRIYRADRTGIEA